jgi:hypothetical protein
VIFLRHRPQFKFGPCRDKQEQGGDCVSKTRAPSRTDSISQPNRRGEVPPPMAVPSA